MKYYINTTVNLDMDKATEKVAEELKKEGFGIVTQFDVNKALKEKLDMDFRPYRILGACNPAFAVKSIGFEDKIGTILPCNVMIQQKKDSVEIAAVNPLSMMSEVESEGMKQLAGEIFNKLTRVIESL